ncbi:MAG: GGDEF domain-containing protein [Velocimicrobium sp.]
MMKKERFSRHKRADFLKNAFLNNQEEIARINQETLSVVGFAGVILTGTLWILSFFLPVLASLQKLYFVISLVLIIALIINRVYIKKRKKNSLLLLYIALMSNYMFAILIGTIGANGQSATAICVFITVLPIFIIDKPIRINAISTIFYVVFSIFALSFKDLDVAVNDMINAAIFLLAGYFVCYHSVNTKIENIIGKKELKDQRDIDFLTKLYNRGAAQKKIDECMKIDKALSALILLDIDNFKGVNDTYGHNKGDDILIETAELLRYVFETKDIISRIGGDEFIVFVPEIKSLSYLYKKVETVIAEMKQDIHVGDEHCHISVSIGIAVAPEAGDDFEKIYKSADLAMYNAKKIGKCTYTVYN